MKASVIGLGAWYPETIRKNDEWPAEFSENFFKRLGDRTLVDIPKGEGKAGELSYQYLSKEIDDPFMGSSQRHVSDGKYLPSEAETFAAKIALEEANLKPASIDLVINVCSTPEVVTPSIANKVARNLGISSNLNFSVESGCAGGLTQLKLAKALIESGQAKNILCTQSHLATDIFPMMKPATPSIGDAGTAFIVSADKRWPILDTHFKTYTEHYESVMLMKINEQTKEIHKWFDSNQGFVILGSLNVPGAKYLMQETVHFGATRIRELLERNNLTPDSLSHIISVSPRSWIPGAIAECLGMLAQKAPQYYKKYSHLGVCGFMSNWYEAYKTGQLKDAGLVGIYAQGTGFVSASALIDFRAP